MDSKKKKTTLTSDDMQMLAEMIRFVVKEEIREEMDKQVPKMTKLISESIMVDIDDRVRHIVKEETGNLPTKEEFYSYMDRRTAAEVRIDHEQLLLSHQYQRQDQRISQLEADVKRIHLKLKKVS